MNGYRTLINEDVVQAKDASSTVLVVDDDPDMSTMISKVLADQYHVFTAQSAAEALDFINTAAPEMVLLDIGLPDRSGLSVCQHIKDQPSANMTSVMCVSGYKDTKDIIKAYRAGADDYITKPFDAKLLKAKVDNLAQFRAQQASLVEENQMTEQVAFQSMLEASNYGEVIQFFKNTISTENVSSLTQTFFSLMSALDLAACIYINIEGEIALRSDGAECSPIEKQLFNSLRHSGRIYSFNDRAVVNDQHVSILVKNMPKDESIRGRIADLLCIINELVEEKVKDILRRAKIVSAQRQVSVLSSALSGQMTELEQGAMNQLNMVEQLERGFDFMDLTSEQENFFQSLFEQSREDLEKLNDYLKGLDNQLSELSLVLQS